jgi:hypothetical protein
MNFIVAHTICLTMPPIAHKDLVAGQVYTRVSKTGERTYEITRPFVYSYEQGGTTILCFEFVGRSLHLQYNADYYDFYVVGTQPVDIPPYIARTSSALCISQAEDIGILKESYDILLTTDFDSITYDPFVDGDKCVQIIHPCGNFCIPNSSMKCFVYHAKALDAWFHQGKYEEPRTRMRLQQSDLKKFIYRS